MNYCWFWDLEKVFPGYPQFDVAENILHLGNGPKILLELEVVDERNYENLKEEFVLLSF
jgi:hypothetical protein